MCITCQHGQLSLNQPSTCNGHCALPCFIFGLQYYKAPEYKYEDKYGYKKDDYKKDDVSGCGFDAATVSGPKWCINLMWSDFLLTLHLGAAVHNRERCHNL